MKTHNKTPRLTLTTPSPEHVNFSSTYGGLTEDFNINKYRGTCFLLL